MIATEALQKHKGTVLEGARTIYQSFYTNINQLAIFHGVSRAHAEQIAAQKLERVPVDWMNEWLIAIGGSGSGKSFADCYKKQMASLYYPNHQALILRKHHEQLRNTWLATFKEVADKMTCGNPEWLILDERERSGAIEVEYASTTGKPGLFIIRIEPDGPPSVIENSVRGYTIDSFTMEEGTELSEFLPSALITRCRKGGKTHGHILSNPPRSSRHWLPKLASKMEVEAFSATPGHRPFWTVIRSTMEDGRQHLGGAYIETQKRNYADDPLGFQTMVLGLDGTDCDGEPVFGNIFKPELHVRDIAFNPYLPLIRGWDFGARGAACIFFQCTKEGQLRFLGEVIIEDEFVERFVDAVETETRAVFPTQIGGIEDWGDIAGEQKKDTGSSIARIQEYSQGRIQIRTQWLGSVVRRVNHVKRLLSELKNGVPRILVHPRCSELIKMFRGGYYFKFTKTGKSEKPHKDGYFEHIADAMGYGVCGVLPPTDLDSDRESGFDTLVDKQWTFKASTLPRMRVP